jgi:exopolysaccharide biosynthesis protein
VPEAGCLLFFQGRDARAFAARLEPGRPVALKIDLPPADGEVTQAIGGGPRLVRDGKVSVEIRREEFGGVYAAEISKRHPRTAVGFDRGRRTLYLVMVEGRQESSRGMTFRELAEFLVGLGCWQAMAFDGGGSAGMYVADRGMVSYQGSGDERPEDREVANALLLVGGSAPAPAEPPR